MWIRSAFSPASCQSTQLNLWTEIFCFDIVPSALISSEVQTDLATIHVDGSQSASQRMRMIQCSGLTTNRTTTFLFPPVGILDV